MRKTKLPANIGRAIQAEREELGLSQKQLGSMVTGNPISQGDMSDYECGKTDVGFRNAEAICLAMDKVRGKDLELSKIVERAEKMMKEEVEK